MNCISPQQRRTKTALEASRALLAACRQLASIPLLVAVCACAVAAPETPADKIYNVDYVVTPEPQNGTARVELLVVQPRRLLRELSMFMPTSRYSGIEGDGEIIRDGKRVRWLPPAAGGTLRWTVKVNHKRYGDKYDAWLGDDWGLFRASDIMPPPRTRTVVGAHSRTTLRFALPKGWSAVTPYRKRRGAYPVASDNRRFDRPKGWMLTGRLGTRLETIAGVRVLVSGPTGEDVRRMDMLALLNWTLPSLKKVLPDFPRRLTVVSASGSMWRGGLSGPASLYLHASLPLISENGTSTLLHEVMHIGMGMRAADGADWIVEGLAEYYSLELLRRSRTISNERFNDAIRNLVEWGEDADELCASASTGATTAKAVGIFAALQRELHTKTKNAAGLDKLLRALVDNGNMVGVADLRRVATDIAGTLPDVLSNENLGGCDTA